MRLFYRLWEAQTARGIALLVHGLGEHSGRYEELAKHLNSRWLTVFALDHRGHGRSEGHRGDCRSLRQFVEDLHQFVGEIKSNSPSLPRILIGHSLGGLIAWEYAHIHPEEIEGLILSSPAFRLAKEPSRLKVGMAKGFALLAPGTHFPNGVDPSLLSHDPGIVEAYRKDPLVHRVITARCAVALQKAMKEALQRTGDLKVPCLLLQAGSDRICNPEAASQWAKRVKGAPLTFRRYEGLYHEIFNETKRAQVLEDLSGWIENLLNQLGNRSAP